MIEHEHLLTELIEFADEQGADFGLWYDSDTISEEEYQLVSLLRNKARHPANRPDRDLSF